MPKKNKKQTEWILDQDGKPLPPDARELLSVYRNLHPIAQKAFQEHLDLMVQAQKEGKPLPKIKPDIFHICSFCGRHADKVRRLIAAPNYVFICEECVEVCNKILKEEDILTSAIYKNILGKPLPAQEDKNKNQIIFEQKDDKFTFFFKNRKKRAEGKCINGLFEGKWLFYNASGTLIQEGHFKENEKHGKWKQFNKSGEVIKQAVYKNGKLVSKT